MTVTEIKHAAKQREWEERIMECRNSGAPVRRWCAERQICPTTYYRWEREIFGGLGKKGSKSQSLAVPGPEFAAAPSIKPRGGAGQVIITVRTGTAEIDICAGAGEQEIEAVLRVLKLC